MESEHLFPSYYNTIRFLHPSPPTTQLLGNSMVLKLYGNSQSPNARLVASILLEKEVSFELVDLGWNETKLPKYLELQPFGQMPCIVSETNPSLSPSCRTMNIISYLLIAVLFRTMMDLFSTKAKRSVIISHPSIQIKEPHYFQLNLKPTRSSIKPYQ